jgi:predicted GNAT superfamily acetyltransferase
MEFPADFQSIKRIDKALAIAWRLHVRSICEAAFTSGYTVIDYVHEAGQRARSFYVMQRIDSSESALV